MCRSLFSFYVRIGYECVCIGYEYVRVGHKKNDETLESRHYFYSKLVFL